MSLLSVEDALARLLDGAEPVGTEDIALGEAAGRVLAGPLRALRTQPPFPASAMDGYAVRAADVAAVPATVSVIGIAPAGRPFAGKLGPGEAVRIFTGAPVPEGADAVVIQEDSRDLGGGRVELTEATRPGRNVRRAGLDFAAGDVLIEAGRLLDGAALSLAAAANHPRLTVLKRPLVAIIATGDELLPVGSEPGPGQIISSNAFGVAAIVRAVGADVLDLGIVHDDTAAIAARVRAALAAGADIVVTLGGASVGDHDLVHEVLTGEGMSLDFWKIAMRPGKPLMFGRLGSTRCLGLPGNPVSTIVCSHLFLKPLVARLAGRSLDERLRDAALGRAMPANDRRQDYVRAVLGETPDGPVATPFAMQDSSMLKTLADANALIVREPLAPAADAGASCRVMVLR